MGIEYEGTTLLTLPESEEFLNISTNTLRYLRAQNILPTVSVPGLKRKLIPLEALSAYKDAVSSTRPDRLLVALLSRMSELERKLDWVMSNLPTPADEYRRAQSILEENHPEMFSRGMGKK